MGHRDPGWGGLWGVAEALGLGWSVGQEPRAGLGGLGLWIGRAVGCGLWVHPGLLGSRGLLG